MFKGTKIGKEPEIAYQKIKNLQTNETIRLRYKKAIALAAQIIIDKNKWILSKDDIKEIATKCYKSTSYLKLRGINRLMHTDIAKIDIGIAITQLYMDNGFDKDYAMQLLKDTIQIAKDTRKAETLLKIHDKIENRLGMGQTTTTTVKKTIDYKAINDKVSNEQVSGKIEETTTTKADDIDEETNE